MQNELQVTELEMTNAISDSQEETNFLDAFSEYSLRLVFYHGQLCPCLDTPSIFSIFRQLLLIQYFYS